MNTVNQRTRVTLGALVTTTMLAAVGLAGGATASATTASPFDPGANGATQGAISFYDSSGQQVTGGPIDDGPAYAVADTDAGRVGDTLASLYAATPTEGVDPGNWPSQLIAAPVTFSPAQSLPGDITGTTTAVVSGSFGAWLDLNDGHPATYPNTNNTAEWQNLYQLRILTSGPGQQIDSSRFSSATIAVDTSVGMWTQIYPRPLITPVVTSPAAISGTPKTGQMLTCDVSFDGADTVAYAWARNGTPIATATSASYKTTPADYLQELTCTATATSIDALTAESSSAGVTVLLGDALVNVKQPKIIGAVVKGAVVSCGPGTWTPKATSYRYRWLRNDQPVNGGTSQLFLIPRTFKGDLLLCRVTALKNGFANGVATSNAATVG
ncbi:MAG: hypothetical protein LH645_11205 [Actinomycetia bacterium]|nr:hypothetical protein [Actinomycetes bacterium]